MNGHGTLLSDPYDIVGDFTAGLRVTDDQLAVGYDSVPVTVNEPSSCPDAPYAGYTITQDFIDSDGDFFHFQMMTGWHWKAGVIFDSDFLSSGDGICIYSQEVEEDGTFGGELRYYDPMGDEGWGFTAVGPDYPGEQGVCVDVDSTDLVAFVTLGDNFYEAFGPPSEWTLSDYINESNDYFTVVDPYVGQSSEVVVNVGTRIRAIDIDGYDDIWVLDIDNVMHRYVKGTSPLSYTEDVTRQFDLDIATGGLFTGQVYEFVINFHNEAFFILTDNTAKCDLWRFECDGVYYSNINGNANPMIEVLAEDCTGNADIVIDNLDASGNHLTGAQDSQIVVVSGYNPSNNWHTIMSRVDSELDQKLTHDENWDASGIQTAYIDQRTNELWGWHRSNSSDSWAERWTAPSQWE